MKRPLALALIPLIVTASTACIRGDDAASSVDQADPADGVDLADGVDGRDLSVTEFAPRSRLRVVTNLRDQAKFPVVDVHGHFHYRLKNSRTALDDYVDAMNRSNVAVSTSLDGLLNGQFESHREFLWQRYRDRFVIFANVDWVGDGDEEDPASWACHRPGFARRQAKRLAAAVAEGASGLKVFKRFGLGYRNPDGSLMEIDDPRWDPIWAKCGELGIPVIIHTADPIAFFEPIDATNERWLELQRHPDWSFYGDEYPSRESLLEARNRVIERHPGTNFIGAHIANSSEDLATADRWLMRYPNLYVETASRISELGRQPRAAKAFLNKHADRVMFGTDGPFPEARLRINWRFFETADEHFDYSEQPIPPQGMWRIYGIELRDEVLRKIYHENAARLIPGVASRVRTFAAERGLSTNLEGSRSGGTVDVR